MSQFESYKIVMDKRARKALLDLPKSDSKRIVLKLQSLVSSSPEHLDIKKLRGYENLYRLRVGNYRSVFVVVTEKKELIVVAIGHRKDVYEIAKRLSL